MGMAGMRILVADDHSLFRDGVVSLLEAAGFEVIGQAGDGAAAVEAALRLRPDLVLMDISMPQLGGLEALRQLRAAWPEARVVMLTVSDDNADLFEAVEAGAAGYLLKSLNSDEFVEMLRGVQRGEAALTRRMTSRLMSAMAAHQAQSLDHLTPREVELLQLLA